MEQGKNSIGNKIEVFRAGKYITLVTLLPHKGSYVNLVNKEQALELAQLLTRKAAELDE